MLPRRSTSPVIPDQWVHLVGSVVIWWARTEGLIATSLLAMRQHPDIVPMVGTKRFPRGEPLIEEWASARRLIFPEKAAETDEWESQLKTSAEYRHRIVHDFWPYLVKPGAEEVALSFMKGSRGGGVDMGGTKIRLDDLREAEQNLSKIYHSVMADAFMMPKRVLEAQQARGWTPLAPES